MRTTIEIIRDTEKAKLVKCGDKQAWLPHRWVRDDLTVKTETFEKSAIEFARTETARNEAQEFKNGMHDLLTIERENDKAVAINASIYEECTDQQITRLVWFPKSQVKNNQAPGWLFLAKANDLRERVRMPAGGAYTVSLAGMDF
jgi:hypothetical protein